jgi:N6-adenosine-specific RNA methylase IME4
METIIVNGEFKKLIPLLSEDEFENLERSILEEGCRDALVLWGDVLVDGHNRYDICCKHNLPFKTIRKVFSDESDVKVWMIDNQLARRNLPEFVRFELLSSRKAVLLQKGKEKMVSTLKQGQEAPGLSNVDKAGHNTRDVLASGLNWSTGKLAMAEVVLKQASEEQKTKLRQGDETIHNIYKKVKHEQVKKEFVQKQAEPLQGKYNIIYADPPWQYYEGGNKNQSQHYTTMPFNEIKALPIKELSNDNCILFLWVTYPILDKAFELIKEWGFEYSTCGFVWVKSNKTGDGFFFGLGSWTRANTELCLIATKGSVPRQDASISQIIYEPVGEHSKKPDIVRDKIVQLVGDLPRIELFARQKTEGWSVWGNETTQ